MENDDIFAKIKFLLFSWVPPSKISFRPLCSYESNPMIFDKENAKKETMQTNKNELWDEVEEVRGDYVIKRPLDESE